MLLTHLPSVMLTFLSLLPVKVRRDAVHLICVVDVFGQGKTAERKSFMHPLGQCPNVK